MALVIYLKGEGNQALVVKGTMIDFRKKIINGWGWLTLDGWHGKKMIISTDQISHVIEETDAQMKKNMEENKKQAEARVRAQGQGIIKAPGLVIPGRGNN